MHKNIRLMENLVSRAVKRLEQLTAERKALQDELAAVRRELEDSAPAEASGDGDEEWRSRRDQAVSLIQKTLAEIREH